MGKDSLNEERTTVEVQIPQMEKEDSTQRRIIEPGIYDISNEEYHASSGISRSCISEFKKSPLHYWDRYLNPKRKIKKPSPQMIMGSAIHTLILEPHKFDEEFCILKKIDFRTNAGKEYKKEFEENSKNKTIIKEEDMETITEMVDAAFKNAYVKPILSNADIEKSIYWKDKTTGLLCKTRPDIWLREKRIVCDLKTARSASRDAFARAIYEGDYHIQAAMAVTGIKEITGESIEEYLFIVIPNERPHFPYLYRLDIDSFKKGLADFKDGLSLIKECTETNNWHKERNSIQNIGLSDYALSLNPFYQLQEQSNHD